MEEKSNQILSNENIDDCDKEQIKENKQNLENSSSRENTKNLLLETKELETLISNHKTISSAIDNLQKLLQISKQICYDIIIDTINNNHDIKLVDDYNNNNKNNEDDLDKIHTENIISSMTEHELNDLQQTLESYDNKDRYKS